MVLLGIDVWFIADIDSVMSFALTAAYIVSESDVTEGTVLTSTEKFDNSGTEP
jgi:hypothetical protein